MALQLQLAAFISLDLIGRYDAIGSEGSLGGLYVPLEFAC